MSSMSQNGIDTLRLEYEHLYNLRDQTLLFLEMCPENEGYADRIRVELDEMIKEIVAKLFVHRSI